MLDSGRDTVDTLIHELAHHTTHSQGKAYEDGEKDHYLEMTRLAGFVVQRTARGDYDVYVKDPEFSW